MALGAEADRLVGLGAGEIDGEGKAVVDIGFALGDQAFGLVQALDQVVGLDRRAGAEADLRQARAGAREDGKGARRDLGIERALIAFRHGVEGLGVIGDDAGEDVEAAGRALRVGGGGDVGREIEAFEQRHDIGRSRSRARRRRSGRSCAATGSRAGRPTVWGGAGQERGAHAVGREYRGADRGLAGWIWSASSRSGVSTTPVSAYW